MKDLGGDARAGVHLFGEQRVEGPSGPMALSPQQIALVTLVYGHWPRGLTRSQAARLLWGSDNSPRARQRLRQLVLEVRSRGGRELLDTPGDRLEPAGGVGCDLAFFHHALTEGSLARAASMLLEGFAEKAVASVADGYEDWRLAKREALEAHLRSASLKTWMAASEAADWTAARDAAEALHSLDPRDPGCVVRVIEARARVGMSVAAESALTDYLESLDRGQEPAPDVLDSIARVRRLRGSGWREGPEPDEEVPIIGRGEALAAARTIFSQVAADRFGFVLISGESGIGKTRLLSQLEREAVLEDFRCLHAQAVELESRIPLNPLLDALKPVDLRPHLGEMGRPWSAVIRTILPSDRLEGPVEELPAIQDSALPRRLLDALFLLFDALAREAPTLLFIDDIQWADATTVAALQFVQRRWEGGPLGIIATVRPELVGPTDPVSKYLMRTEELSIRRVELRELPATDALALVSHIGAGHIDEADCHRICALAGHHPLYLTELTRDYLAGRLRIPETKVDEVTIPVSLKQILDTRLQGVGDRPMKVAGLLAVAARALRLPDLARMAAMSLDEAADAAEELRAARLVEVDRDRVRIAHELFRSAIYRHLGELRRALNHRTVADFIVSEGAEDSAGELAAHYARAGESELAAKFGRVAADRAMETGALAEAAHFFQLVTENESDPVRRADATAHLARVLHLTRDISRANPLLELAASRLRVVGRSSEALRLDIKRVEGLAEVGAIPIAHLLKQLSAIKAVSMADRDWEALALALDTQLHLLHRAGDVAGIRHVFGEMRATANQGSADAALIAKAGLALGVLFEDPEEAVASAWEAADLADHGSAYRLHVLVRLILALQYRGLLAAPTAEPVVNEARRLAERSGDRLLRVSIESNLAVAHLDAGDLDTAEALMAHSRALIGDADMDLHRSIHANNRGELALAQHDFDSAQAAFLEASRYLGLTTPAYMQDLVTAGLGLCALETGSLREAQRLLAGLQEPPPTWYFDPTTVVAFRTRLLELTGEHEEALRLLEVSAQDLDGRLVLAWLKIRAIQVRLMKRHGVGDALRVGTDALQRATDLGLRHRIREFADLVTHLG